MGIEAYSTTAANNNAAPPNGAPEGMAPSAVNDVIRQVMADIRSQWETGIWFNYGHTPTRTGNTTFTVATDLTAVYHIGRRIKMTGSATGYATITNSAFATGTTTVTVVNDSGNIPATLSTVSVSLLPETNQAFPANVRAGGGGSVAAPDFSSVTDTNTGFAIPAADRASVVAGGLEMLRSDASLGNSLAHIVRFTGIISPTILSANQNDWNPTDLGTSSVVRVSSDASRNITGINTSALLGRLLIILNVGANDVVLVNESASSTAAYRFHLPGSSNLTVSADEGVVLFYDVTSSRWRLIRF